MDETHEMDWKEYALALILFSGVSMVLLYALQRMQHCAWLPLEPAKTGRSGPGTGLQHGSIVHDKYELAELRA